MKGKIRSRGAWGVMRMSLCWVQWAPGCSGEVGRTVCGMMVFDGAWDTMWWGGLCAIQLLLT